MSQNSRIEPASQSLKRARKAELTQQKVSEAETFQAYINRQRVEAEVFKVWVCRLDCMEARGSRPKRRDS